MLNLFKFAKATPAAVPVSFLDRLALMDNEEDQSLLQAVAAEMVKTLKVAEAAKFASVILLKRVENVKNLELVYQRQNSFSFAYYLTKELLNEIGYPIKKKENCVEILEMMETIVMEVELYDNKIPFSQTITAKKLKEMFFNSEISKSILLILFPFYRNFIQQAPNPDVAKKLFTSVLFDFFLRDILLASPDKKEITQEQKIVLIERFKLVEVFSPLITKLDKCKLEKQVEISEGAINVAQGIFDKHQRKAKIKREVGPIKERIKELTRIFKQCENDRYLDAIKKMNGVFKTLVDQLFNDATLTQERIDALLEKGNEDVTAIVSLLINEPIDGLTLLHRYVMLALSTGPEAQRDKQQYQCELERLLREGAKLELTTTSYQKGLMSSVLLRKNEPLTVMQLAERYGNSAALSQAIEAEAVKSEEPTPIEIVDIPDRVLGWQRGQKRDRGQRTPPTTPPVTPRGTQKPEGDVEVSKKPRNLVKTQV